MKSVVSCWICCATTLGALSFFVPSAMFDALMQVTDLSRNALEMTIDRLSALSLVDVLVGAERYALHSLTRAFVHDELLADANVAHDTDMRFVRFWAEWLKRDSILGKPNKILEEYSYDRPNLDAAGVWLKAQANAMETQMELAQSIVKRFEVEGKDKDPETVEEYKSAMIEAISVVQNATKAFAALADFNESYGDLLLVANGQVSLQLRDFINAKNYFAEALSRGHELGQENLIGNALLGLARVHEAEGHADLALPLAQEALKIYERLQHTDLAEARELVERLKAKQPPP